YPVSHKAANAWLEDFTSNRLDGFGPYEDAIVGQELSLYHSVLSPLLNIGLLRPETVVEAAVEALGRGEAQLPSVEGFVRQIVGWREFIRGVYVLAGRQERSRNYFGFSHALPEAFYQAATGVEPVDATIRKLHGTAYNHHIERLMVLGNFMLLCEIAPDEVYRWFMEMYIDAYDWVMVPNVYGMSQLADGGLMSTKPYFSGSRYLLSMSDYSKGGWAGIWDALFWRFIHRHRDKLKSNPRIGMLSGSFDRMALQKQSALLENAERFLQSLHKNPVNNYNQF
ncbi:MAG: cryptochrome/photolyase family protein, partial [Bacteroidia bacterium]|nr:cryptochrome/photolyase family protein [Bacteroidia bacterium]